MTDDAGRQDALATVPKAERRLSRAEFQGLGICRAGVVCQPRQPAHPARLPG
jgi:hypothetical protein